MGKLTITPDDYRQAAMQYRTDLLYTPFYTLGKFREYLTERPGIRFGERVGKITGGAQLAPYNGDNTVDAQAAINFRTLYTYHGAVAAEFEPNSVISTLMGRFAQYTGEGQQNSEAALAVLRLIAESIGEHLYNSMWNAKRKENGTTTADLFDGYDTITEAEITAGNISAAKGNLLELTENITSANAYDIARQILKKLDPHLRNRTCYLHCTQEFYDQYCEAYLKTHGATPYNAQFDQTAVEGSNGRLILAPHVNKTGAKFFQVTTKENMLLGYDLMSDDGKEQVSIYQFHHFKLRYVASNFIGVQWASIDKEDFMAVKLKPAA